MLIINKFYNKDTRKTYAQAHKIVGNKEVISYGKVSLDSDSGKKSLEYLLKDSDVNLVFNVAKSGDLSKINFIEQEL